MPTASVVMEDASAPSLAPINDKAKLVSFFGGASGNLSWIVPERFTYSLQLFHFSVPYTCHVESAIVLGYIWDGRIWDFCVRERTVHHNVGSLPSTAIPKPYQPPFQHIARFEENKKKKIGTIRFGQCFSMFFSCEDPRKQLSYSTSLNIP